MSEVEAPETEEEGVVALEEKRASATEETYVLYTTAAQKQGDEGDSVIQPLLQRKHQDSCEESRGAGARTPTDGSDQKTSVRREPGLAGGDRPSCGGSVGSLCSGGGRHECPICRELLDSRGDHRVALLNCNHALCQRCAAGIMSRARDPSRLQCPFCRQTTPFPQWEIRRLQEESYSCSTYELGPAIVVSSGQQPADPASPPRCCPLGRTHTNRNACARCIHPSGLVRGLRLMQLYVLCVSIAALLLLFLVVPVVLLSIFYKGYE